MSDEQFRVDDECVEHETLNSVLPAPSEVVCGVHLSAMTVIVYPEARAVGPVAAARASCRATADDRPHTPAPTTAIMVPAGLIAIDGDVGDAEADACGCVVRMCSCSKSASDYRMQDAQMKHRKSCGHTHDSGSNSRAMCVKRHPATSCCRLVSICLTLKVVK